MDIAKLIDHSLLRADAKVEEIRKLCDEAREHAFHSVCVNSFFVPFSKESLVGSGVKVATVVGFPLGMTAGRVKVYEAMEACLSGADELDIVMNIGMAKSGRWDAVEKDISGVVAATRGVIRKVIIETCYLDKEGKKRVSGIVAGAGAEFIKTSTGFGPSGALVEDVLLIKAVVGERCGIKAAGGIRTLAQVREFVAAGATRIGTSSGVAIMKELHAEQL